MHGSRYALAPLTGQEPGGGDCSLRSLRSLRSAGCTAAERDVAGEGRLGEYAQAPCP